MDKRTKKEKGDDLELAVYQIESCILREAVDFRDKTLVIERKKIVNVDGVHHELDVWAQVVLAKGYDPVYVFECKNWNQKVGKNEIILFEKKVHDVSAAKGFFVARKFTKDAKAEAKKNHRVELLECDETMVEHPTFVNLPVHCRQKVETTIQIQPFGVKGKTLKSVAPESVKLNGETIDADEFFKSIVGGVVDDAWQKYRGQQETKTPLLGVRNVRMEADRRFAQDELVIDGKCVEVLRVKVEFQVTVIKPRIRSCVDVKSRGRVHMAENIDVAGAKVGMGFMLKNPEVT